MSPTPAPGGPRRPSPAAAFGEAGVGARRHALLRRRGIPWALAATLLVLSWGCGSSAPKAPQPAAPPPPQEPVDRPYLVSPLEGWSEPLDPEVAESLRAGHEALELGELERAMELADEVAGSMPPDFPPSQVLAAEVELVERQAAAARNRLEPLAADHPTYTALQLALGRAAEQTGDLVLAYASFRNAAPGSDLAYQQVAELEPRVLEVLDRRVEDALQRVADAAPNRARAALDTASEALDRLQAWMPDAPETLVAAVDVAAAREDRAAELEALRRLVPRVEEIGEALSGRGEAADPRPWVERLAELELAVGSSKTGLDLLSELAAENPDDPRLAERLAFAKFRWRVDQMPPQVSRAASLPVLQRGDLAVLLYWLVPQVRSASGGQARIASDILDDPRRSEIARVANLGLMDMDAAVYRFYPARETTRGVALESVLRVLRRFGGATCTPPPAGASAGSDGGETPSVGASSLCRSALECGLLAAPAECRAGEPVSGGDAVELVRRALGWLAERETR